MAGSYDSSNLVAFQDYVRTYQDDLFQLGLAGAPSMKYFMKYPGVKGEHIITYDIIADIVKRFALDFAPDADTWTQYPSTIKSVLTKAEMRVSPKQDLLNYRAYLVDTKQKAEDHPYAQYIMEKASRKLNTQIEFDQLYTGDENGGGSNAADLFNGLLTLIADDQALGTPLLTPVATGVINSANAIASFEAVDDAIPEERKNGEEWLMRVGPALFKLYRRAYRSAAGFHPNNPDTDAMNEIMIDGSTTKVVMCPGMGSSQRIICTPKRNTYVAYDAENDTQMWEFEQDHRFVDMWCDYWFGGGFVVFHPDIIIINDQA